MEKYINEREILRGAARALFVTSWASNEERFGRTYPGQELTEVAPPTSVDALLLAAQLLGRIEQLNSFPASVLYAKALELNAQEGDGVEGRDTPYEFGFTLAMESLGTGISWNDNNAYLDINYPHYMEVEWSDVVPTKNILKVLGAEEVL